MSADLQLTQAVVSGCMDNILACFKPGAKITVVVRRPGNDDADFLMTNEAELSQVKALIDRRESAGAAA